MIIYLYIKQHSITGLKYFGYTKSKNPFKYKGSGKYWKPHIVKHGEDFVKTIDIWGFDQSHYQFAKDFAIKFSLDNNIVESKQWANLKIEKLDGGWPRQKSGKNHHMYGVKQSTETIEKRKLKGDKNPRFGKPGTFLGKTHTEHTRKKISEKAKGRHVSEDTKNKISNFQKGRPKSEDFKQQLRKPKPEGFGEKISNHFRGKKQETIECPHCKKIGSISNMKRWHFDNCNQRGSLLP